MAKPAKKKTQTIVTGMTAEAPAGGGAFTFEHVSVGIFLTDQPGHRIAVGSDKTEERPLKADQGWILPAGVEGICEFDLDHRFASVEVPASLLSDAGLASPAGFAPHVGSHDPLLIQMAKSALLIDDTQGSLYRETMHRALAAHLVQLVAPAPPAEAAVDDQRLRRALAYLNDNLATDFSLDDLAAEAGMSPFHFSRMFKKATGKSPLQYVIGERITAAKVLLTTTQLAVSEIAYRVGYEDVSRFGQHFKRAVGATPARFRAG